MDQTWLKKFLHYEPDTGIFTRLKCKRSHLVGKEAGGLSGRGHRYIMVEGKSYPAHHLAWLYVTGEWPIGEIDHRDLNKDNNAFKNLRPATTSQNMANTATRSDNSSGVKGVHYLKASKRWQARIGFQGTRLFLGSFGSKQEAAEAYAKAANDLFGEFARPSRKEGTS